MKKLLLICLSLSTVGVFANYGPAGCGLGTHIFMGKKGLIFNVLAATTNGTSGNQTFGMTTGTLGCKVDDSTSVAAINFIEGNRVALSRDIAVGQGESLAALSKIYGCENVEVLGESLQSNYRAIFKSDKAEKINREITNTVVAQKSCV